VWSSFLSLGLETSYKDNADKSFVGFDTHIFR
jgi:hypothetical protein